MLQDSPDLSQQNRFGLVLQSDCTTKTSAGDLIVCTVVCVSFTSTWHTTVTSTWHATDIVMIVS